MNALASHHEDIRTDVYAIFLTDDLHSKNRRQPRDGPDERDAADQG